MGASDTSSRRWTILALAPLVTAWIVAIVSLAQLFPALGRLSGANAVASISLQLTVGLTIVVLALSAWAAYLLLARQGHTRQWTAVCVFSVVILFVWFFTRTGAIMPDATRLWVTPAYVEAAVWLVGGLGLYLVVLSLLVLRRAPAPLHERYSVGPFHASAVDPVENLSAPATMRTLQEPAVFEERSSLQEEDGGYKGPDELAP